MLEASFSQKAFTYTFAIYETFFHWRTMYSCLHLSTLLKWQGSIYIYTQTGFFFHLLNSQSIFFINV